MNSSSNPCSGTDLYTHLETALSHLEQKKNDAAFLEELQLMGHASSYALSPFPVAASWKMNHMTVWLLNHKKFDLLHALFDLGWGPYLLPQAHRSEDPFAEFSRHGDPAFTILDRFKASGVSFFALNHLYVARQQNYGTPIYSPLSSKWVVKNPKALSYFLEALSSEPLTPSEKQLILGACLSTAVTNDHWLEHLKPHMAKDPSLFATTEPELLESEYHCIRSLLSKAHFEVAQHLLDHNPLCKIPDSLMLQLPFFDKPQAALDFLTPYELNIKVQNAAHQNALLVFLSRCAHFQRPSKKEFSLLKRLSELGLSIDEQDDHGKSAFDHAVLCLKPSELEPLFQVTPALLFRSFGKSFDDDLLSNGLLNVISNASRTSASDDQWVLDLLQWAQHEPALLEPPMMQRISQHLFKRGFDQSFEFLLQLAKTHQVPLSQPIFEGAICSIKRFSSNALIIQNNVNRCIRLAFDHGLLSTQSVCVLEHFMNRHYHAPVGQPELSYCLTLSELGVDASLAKDQNGYCPWWTNPRLKDASLPFRNMVGQLFSLHEAQVIEKASKASDGGLNLPSTSSAKLRL